MLRLPVLLVLSAILLCAGCGGPGQDAQADARTAAQQAQAACERWQAGGATPKAKALAAMGAATKAAKASAITATLPAGGPFETLRRHMDAYVIAAGYTAPVAGVTVDESKEELAAAIAADCARL